MANIIAREDYALTVGGGSCASYSANRAVTKALAVAFGCTIRLDTYSNNLLVAKVDIMKVTACSCNVHSKTLCASHGYCASNCGCNTHSLTYCTNKSTCACNTHSKTLCTSKGYVAATGSYCSATNVTNYKADNSGSHGGTSSYGCWPHGSKHTIGCTQTYYNYSGLTRKLCGCKGVATNCSCYCPSNTSMNNDGCCCNTTTVCVCQNIIPQTGTCGCNNSICSGYAAASCSCNNSVCSCDSGNCSSHTYCTCNSSVCSCNSGNCGSHGTATCSCNNSVCSCNSGNCASHSATKCTSDCPANNS